MNIPVVKDDKVLTDIYSRILKDRIILLYDEINSETARLTVAQLLYLESIDSTKPISIYINSPGGVVSDGLAIIDTMNFINAPVHTYCMGCCASMGAMILSQGEKGHRYSLPSGSIMIHQPLGGVQGQATDINITANQIMKTKKRLTNMLAEACDKPFKKLEADMERDYYMDSEEAMKYGIIDEVLYGNKLNKRQLKK